MFLLAQGIFGHDTSSLRFDVGEIKIDSSNSVPDYEFVDGRLRIINIDLKGLIQLAMFGTVRGARPVFGPAVLDTVRVDVIAKAESPATSIPDARAMLLNLLKDRMQLKFHFENREMPAYALIRNGANFEMPESQGPPGQCDASSKGRSDCRSSRTFTGKEQAPLQVGLPKRFNGRIGNSTVDVFRSTCRGPDRFSRPSNVHA